MDKSNVRRRKNTCSQNRSHSIARDEWGSTHLPEGVLQERRMERAYPVTAALCDQPGFFLALEKACKAKTDALRKEHETV